MAEITIHPTVEEMAQEAARRWVEIAKQAVTERGAFRVALAGGSTPRSLYSLMASEPWRSQVPWGETYVFWGDERRVPPSDPESNYRMAQDTLLQHVPVPPNQVFRMDGEELANSAARNYADKIMRHFELERREWPRFDLALLGLGSDGHIASIFPGTRAVSDLSNMVLVYSVPQLGTERMTLTLPAFNNARNVLFLVAGGDKAEALAQALEGRYQPSTHPAQAVKLVDGSLVWLVDEAAAAKLTNR